jgi:putative selenate reductase
MPADEEELALAIEDGVAFAELLAPVEYKNGYLICKKMVLSDVDASGRRGVVETDEVVEVKADTVIAAVGEQVPGEFYKASGILVDGKGRPTVNSETTETSVKGIYVVGDGLNGPATVVEGIRDGRKAADSILNKAKEDRTFVKAEATVVFERKGNLVEEDTKVSDAKRCLSCNTYCENCVEVCPNRANIAIDVKVGTEIKTQIVHADYMCNECGNCKSFCPWDGAPYLNKFTLFANVKDLGNSKNQGFTVLDKEKGEVKIRLFDKEIEYVIGAKNEAVPSSVDQTMKTVIEDYAYLLSTK